MSSNNPQRGPQSGIPKPASSSSSALRPPTTGQMVGSKTMPRAKVQTETSAKLGALPSTQKGSTESIPVNWAELEAKYRQDIESLTESTEMATIEKEIAEEKLDGCEREIQDLKDKLAEATLQIDMLKRDQQSDRSVGAGTSESTVTVLQLQKVEEQNELLKQALIKLRDMSAKDKKALEDLQIEHEELQLKALDLEEKENNYLEQIKNLEEQVDVNQSAQEMVEKLTQQKAELEDKLKEMIDDFDCMEKLRDLNEQLLENARETEIELTGKIDMLRVQCSELNNKKRDLEDYLADQERTMAKLKDENRALSEHITRLKDQFKEGESIEQQKHQIENVAYKLNFSESKMLEKEAEIARCKRNLADMEEQMNNLSLITKEQSARLDELKMQYESKVNENSELQRALKKKMEEVSELEIRREMAEKKLQSIQKDKEAKIASLTRTIETMKGIEVQHEEDMKRLMEDYDLIEKERRELKDQINRSNRSMDRTMQTPNITMVTAQDTSLASLGISFQSTPSRDSPIQTHHISTTQQQTSQMTSTPLQQASHMGVGGHSLGHEAARRLFPPSSSEDVNDNVYIGKIKELSATIDRVTRKNHELEVELVWRELNSKAPPYNDSNLVTLYDMDRAKCLRREACKLKREIRAAIINQQICTKSRNITSHARAEQFKITQLALKCQALENEAALLMSNSHLSLSHQNAPILQSAVVN